MIKTVMAVAVAGMFTLPVSASAGSDRMVVAQAGGGADGPDVANRQPGTISSSNFDRLDRNGDGYISRDEAKDAPELQTRFSELDTNNDGKLSREEYDALNSSASGATGTGSMNGSGANTK
jgi:hypothetical protein